MKLYLYYLKSNPNSLYCWTIDKDLSKLFESQRNMDLFIKDVNKDIDEDDKDFRLFSADNSSTILISDVLYDGENTIYISCSRKEASSLDAYIDNIWTVINDINKLIEFHSFNIKEKYLKSILNLTNNITYGGDQESSGELRIDTVSLFIKLFKNTFVKEDK